MKTERVKLYRALDFLRCEPEEPNWEPLIKDGKQIGLRMANVIEICNQHSIIPAIPHLNWEGKETGVMLAFGKHPVLGFLLKEVGAIKINEIKVKL